MGSHSVRGVSAALVALAVALPTSSCLEDLPVAATCPGEAQREITDCTPAIQSVAAGGVPRCFLPDEMECLTGPRTKCGCVADECPAPDPACWPGEDCPADVFEKGGAEARCFHFAPADIASLFDESDQCLCGCAGCAAACDGKGPALGVIADKNMQAFPMTFELGDRLPSSGRLGLYVRVRGVANFAIVLLRGSLEDGVQDDEWLEKGYLFLTPLQDDFDEQVALDQPFAGPAYEWDSPEERPTVLVLFPQIDEGGGLALFELDCLVPFVLPR